VSSTPVLGSRYRLLDRLGRGGMSVVWRAYDQVLGRTVAVKLLAGDATGAARQGLIRSEARMAAQLTHPHICRVYDYGESQSESGDRTPYIVMELLSGVTLEQRLRAGQMPLRSALRVGAQVASALAAAHSSGLVHRDIKPANVMITPSGPKVVDFGTAATAGAPDKPTSDGMQGTPAYLAPERLMDGKVMAASDVYALGVVLYRMVSGTVPWRAETVTQMIEAHQYQEPAPLPPVDGLPAEVAELCQRCLAKEPHRRPTAHEVARRLAEAVGWRVSRAGEELIEDDGDASGPDPDPDAAATEAEPVPPDRGGGGSDRRMPRMHAMRRVRRRPVVLAAAAMVAVAVVTGAAWLASGPGRNESGVETAPDEPAAGAPVTHHPTGVSSPFPGPSGSRADPTGNGDGQPQDTPGDSSPDPGAPGATAPEPEPGTSEAPERPEPGPGEDVVETPGGTVLARCERNAASVEPLDLAPGYRVVDETSGPGPVRASIVLGSSDSEVRVDVQCRAGEPVSTVEVS
jgi:serine/threonine-protein kinase